MNEFFFHLTPEVVITALEKSGLKPTGHCMALNSFENRVYDLKLEDGSHVVSKFYRPGRWTPAQIREEHEFLLELQADEIPVCAPCVTSDGASLHEIEGIYYAIWPRTGGRAADELNDIEVETLGRLLARIHNMGGVRNAQHRITLTGTTYGLEPLAFLIENNFLPAHCQTRYINAVKEIVSLYDSLSKDVPLQRIHGDCHHGNLLKGAAGWFFLDFDDFLMGPAVQDVWMLMPARDQEGQRQREVFLEAYRQFREFDYSWLRLIELLRALRYIRYAAWIAKRWDDPAFPPAFPHFGSVEYWEEQTNDLEDQLDYFYTHTDVPVGMQKDKSSAEPKEFSNKDFFWDWEE